jgi:uncharacterized protein (DUF302 family)
MQMASDGLLSAVSHDGFATTVDRLDRACARRGLTVFARIDHAAAAATVGLALRPTLVLVVGNPRAGTPLMIACPQIAIDLPLRVLVWENNEGRVQLATNYPEWIAMRHSAALAGDAWVDSMRIGMEGLLADAAGERDASEVSPSQTPA